MIAVALTRELNNPKNKGMLGVGAAFRVYGISTWA